jgi:hypothetical protein
VEAILTGLEIGDDVPAAAGQHLELVRAAAARQQVVAAAAVQDLGVFVPSIRLSRALPPP